MAIVLAEGVQTDDLSGLPRRLALLRKADASLSWTLGPVSAVLFDVDHLQALNEKSGRPAGDDLLKGLARLLEGLPGEGSAACRHGGDSFLCLLPKVDKAIAIVFAERLRGKFEKLVPGVTVSAGVATAPADGGDLRALVHAAGLVLVEAKLLGGNRVLSTGRTDKADFASALPCRTLVGRDAEIATAAATFDPILRGKTATLLVDGEAGSGKSRFLAELAAKARTAGLLTISITGDDAKRTLPGGLLKEVIRDYALRRPASQAPLQAEPEAALRAMAAESPLLLLVDNAPAADAKSFAVLRDLVRDGTLPLGLVLALKGPFGRLDEQRGDLPLLELWREAKKHAATMLHLPPLSPDQVEAMICTVLDGADLPEGFPEMIAGASAGNPLYVHAALRGLAVRGKLARTRGGWNIAPTTFDDLPGSLEKAVARLADGLPPKPADLLTQAALLGVVLDLEVLQALVGLKEGEMLDLLDDLERRGLVTFTAAGRVEFAAGSIRDLRRQAIPAAQLQEGRQKASDVLKTLRGVVLEPEALPRPVPVAGAAPGTKVRTRIPESRDPLPDPALQAAARLVQAMMSELKIGRLYPKESRMRTESRERLTETIRELTAAAPRVTFVAEPPVLKVNGVALAGAGEGSAPSLAQLFHDKLVATLTLDRGVAPAELLAALEGLAAPFARETAPPDYWDKFLEEKGLSHLDIVQSRYVTAEKRDTAASSDAALEKPLGTEQVEILWATLQAFKAACDARKLYPAGHKQVEESLRKLTQDSGRLLASAPVVAVSTPQNDLVVNGVSVDSRAVRSVTTWLAAEFERIGVKSVTLRQGVTDRDLRGLVTVLAAEDGPAAAQAIAANRSDRVIYDARSYERPTEQPKESSTKSVPPRPKSATLEETAKSILQASSAKFLSPDNERSLSVFFNDLLEGKLPKQMEPIVDRLGASLRDPSAELRRQAAAMVVKVIDQGSTGAREILVRRLEAPLAAAADAEPDEQIQSIRSWLTAAAALKQHKLVVSFLARLASKTDVFKRTPEIRASAVATLSGLGAPAGEDALDLLSRGDPSLREGAGRVAALLGHAIVHPLVTLVGSHGDLTVRRAAAGALKDIGEGARQLAVLMKADGVASTMRNVLSVYDLTGPGIPEVAQVMRAVSAHPDLTVREAAAGLLTRAKALASPMLVSELLSKTDGVLQKSAVFVAKEMKIREAWGGILKIAEQSQDEEVLRAACNYFREVPMREAIPLLTRLFSSKTRVFGLVKGMSDPTRVAAVEALRKLNNPEAKEVVERALTDTSETVRRAAKPPGP